MEMAANHAHVVWTMLEEMLRTVESTGRADEQLWEALERVQGVTTKMMSYFSEARDGDSEAGKKALGEEAHMFVKVPYRSLSIFTMKVAGEYGLELLALGTGVPMAPPLDPLLGPPPVGPNVADGGIGVGVGA